MISTFKAKIISIAFILLTTHCLFSSGQTHIEGQLIDSLNNQPIPYANIGVVNQNLGTVSDMSGYFKLDIPVAYNDNDLKISIIGYESKTWKVSAFRNVIRKFEKIKLQEAVYQLNDIEVETTKLKADVLGNTSTSKVIEAGFKNNELGNEVGIKIKIKKSPTYLERFNFYVTDCKYDSLLFRLNIYSIKDNMPSKNLLLENIYLSTALKKGKVSVDLKPYNIIVEEDIIVTIEWIQNLGKGGLNFSAGMFNQPMFHRQTSFGQWKKTSVVSLGFNVDVKY
jgi:hypothetical protein